jgi:hypothetical protein
MYILQLNFVQRLHTGQMMLNLEKGDERTTGPLAYIQGQAEPLLQGPLWAIMSANGRSGIAAYAAPLRETQAHVQIIVGFLLK